jgi:hypothetical protein
VNDFAKFMAEHYPEEDPRFIGMHVQDQEDVLAHFLLHLHDDQDKRGVFVAKALVAVRHVFREEGLDVGAFGAQVVTDTRDACVMSLEERKVAAAAAGTTTKAPITLAHIEDMLSNLGKTPLDARGVDAHITVAACIVAYDCVFRCGEYCEPEGKAAARKEKDHKVTAELVGFVILGPDGAEQVVMGIQALRPHLGKWGTPEYSTACVLRVELHTLSGKRQFRKIVKVIARRTAVESASLDRLVRTLDAGNASGSQGMFTRNPNPQLAGKGTGQSLMFRAKRVREEVKASSERLGLDPDVFSSHSLRKAGLKRLGDNGAPRQVMARRGVWTDGSITMSEVYDAATTAVVGPLGSLPEGQLAACAAAELAEARAMMKVRAVGEGIALRAKEDARRRANKELRR